MAANSIEYVGESVEDVSSDEDFCVDLDDLLQVAYGQVSKVASPWAQSTEKQFGNTMRNNNHDASDADEARPDQIHSKYELDNQVSIPQEATPQEFPHSAIALSGSNSEQLVAQCPSVELAPLECELPDLQHKFTLESNAKLRSSTTLADLRELCMWRESKLGSNRSGSRQSLNSLRNVSDLTAPASPTLSDASQKSERGSGSRRKYNTENALKLNGASLSFISLGSTDGCKTAHLLKDKLNDFYFERSELRDAHYHRTLRGVCLLIAISTVIESLLTMLAAIGVEPDILWLLVRCASNVLVATCAMILPGFAVVLVDLDEVALRNSRIRIWISLYFVLFSFVQGMDKPYVGTLGALVAILNVPVYWFSPPFATSLIAILSICLLDAAAKYFAVGFGSMETSTENSQSWVSLSWYLNATYCIVAFGLYTIAWWLQIFSSFAYAGIYSNLSSVSVFQATYAYLVVVGFSSIWATILLLSFDQDVSHLIDQTRIHAGIAFLVPPLFTAALGRHRVFLLLTQRFGLLDRACRERDGALIASMLDSRVIEVGRTWWIHRSKGDENTQYDKDDHRHYWRRGRIVEVSDDSFVVSINGSPNRLPMQRWNASSEELLTLAERHLRCIDWGQMSVAVLQGAQDGTDPDITKSKFIPQARGLKEHEESIDFFISHSWKDDAESKYKQLQKIAEEFIEKHGREPTFWLDHVCIDQNNILDGLKTLPVNIFSCDRLIALCGPTYLSRLWCVWELCTLLAFERPEVAVDRIVISPAGNVTEQDIALHFLNFDISQAKCYDPNEQARVQSVVNAIGHDHFNHMVRVLGNVQQSRSKRRGIGSRSSLTISRSSIGSISLPRFTSSNLSTSSSPSISSV